MAEARTHQAMSAALCGQPLALEPGRAVSTETKFLGPVVTGQRLEAEAQVERSEGRKRWVKVVVRREGTP